MKIFQEDIAWLKENVPARDVAEYLGMEIKKNSILCPNPDHNDRNFGNCHFNRDGSLYCYACGKGFNSLDLMIYEGGLNFPDAVRAVADLAGYRLREQGERKRWVPHLTKEEAELLAIPMSHKKVKLPTTISSFPPDEGKYDEIISVKTTEYVGYREEISPWTTIKESDPEAYKFLVEQRVAYGLKRMAGVYNDAKAAGDEEVAKEAERRL